MAQTRYGTHSGGMSKISSLQEVFVDQIKDLYSAETQIIKALPKMAKAATAPDLKKGFLAHLEQTKEHAARIEALCADLDVKPTGKKCLATAGLVAEGEEAIQEDATPEMKDLMLIAAAQRVEHYEMAGYTSVCSLAKALGLTDALKALSITLSEEVATDEKLIAISVPAIKNATAVEA
jgi:ferritin-like metal-binding protein YciE